MSTILVVDAGGQRAPDAFAPWRRKLAVGTKAESGDPRPRPLGILNLLCERRRRDAIPSDSTPTDRAKRLRLRPRGDVGRRLVERVKQPSSAVGGAIGGWLELSGRVCGAIVPLVQAPLANLVWSLGTATQCVFETVRIWWDGTARISSMQSVSVNRTGASRIRQERERVERELREREKDERDGLGRGARAQGTDWMVGHACGS